MAIYTTLNKLKDFEPCQQGARKLLAHLGKTEPDDEPLAFSTILESNGLDDALWCLRSIADTHREQLWEFMACVVERRMDAYESWAKEQAPEHAGAVRAVVDGLRSGAFADQSAAWSAESAAESAAWSAESAARSAARSAAWSAESAAESAAWSAARSAARSAASAAWSAASAAESAARSAAWSAASAEEEYQAAKLIEIFG